MTDKTGTIVTCAPFLVSFLLCVLILIVYLPVRNYQFVNYDDDVYVSKNINIQSGINPKSISYALTDIGTSNWHPITLLSHMIDWRIYGNYAGGHHLTSVIIHTLSAILLFIFLNAATGALWRSALVAALFALHPINVDSVAWIAERKNVLCTFFWLTAMLFYLRYVRKPGWRRYLPVFIAFVLASMSKPMAVTLPFALLLIDYWPLKRILIFGQDSRLSDHSSSEIKKENLLSLIIEKIPLLAVSAASIAITIYAARTARTIVPMETISFDQRLANAVVSYAAYLKKLMWPADFAVLYPYNPDISSWLLSAAAAGLTAVSLFAIVLWRKYPYAAVGWFWYLGTLIPVSGVLQVGLQSMADRYAYIPFIGLFVALAWGVSDAIKKVSPLKPAVAAAAIISLGILSRQQLHVWENSQTLYQNNIRVAGQHYLPHKNLGLHLIDEKRPQEAARHLSIAASLKTNDPAIYTSLGVAYSMMGDRQAAENEYRKALTINPGYLLALNNLGLLLEQQKRHDEALKMAIKCDPSSAGSHLYLSDTLSQKGLTNEAEIHLEKAFSLDPKLRNIRR